MKLQKIPVKLQHGLYSHDLTQNNELAFSSTGNLLILLFSNTEIFSILALVSPKYINDILWKSDVNKKDRIRYS